MLNNRLITFWIKKSPPVNLEIFGSTSINDKDRRKIGKSLFCVQCKCSLICLNQTYAIFNTKHAMTNLKLIAVFNILFLYFNTLCVHSSLTFIVAEMEYKNIHTKNSNNDWYSERTIYFNLLNTLSIVDDVVRRSSRRHTHSIMRRYQLIWRRWNVVSAEWT